MSWFRNMRLSLKLFASFGFILALMVVLGILAVSRMSTLAARSHEITTNWMPSIVRLSAINTAKSDARIAQLRFIAAANPEAAAGFEKLVQGYFATIEETSQKYTPLIADDTERGLWEQFSRQWRQYLEISARVKALYEQGKIQEAAQVLNESRPLYLSAGEALQKDVEFNVEGGAREAAAAEAVYAQSRTIVIGMLLAAVALGGLVAVLVSRAISGPLSNVVTICQRIAGGHFDNAIAAASRDEIGMLQHNIGEMQSKLRSQIETERKQAAVNFRIRSALDKSSASVMLADENLDIIYTNESAQSLFRSAEADFRRDVPALDASRLVGTNIDVFYREPAQERRVLEGLRGSHANDMRLGGRAMRIVASPVMDAEGKRVGTVVEWNDRTQEVRSEEEVNAVVKRAVEGDLSQRVPLAGKSGFFQNLSNGLNQLLDTTADIVSKATAAATEVYRGAEEISQGNTNLSQRTEEQSSSLEETASSMEEMTSTVKQNADNASQANQLASAARDQAEKGGAVTSRAVAAMTEINEASRRIADIIGVIDEIAFQTNLLALNAAVEAARAGEQGRGFAVVASEVRNLAGRSATAAKEIKGLIQDSVRKVEDGSALVTQSGQTLDQIVASVKKVSDIVAEIAAASREQSSGIEQVNRAVMQMDEMTQQNAALVEQATAASQSMAGQARELNEMMSRYRLGDASGSAPRGALTTAAAPAEPRGTVRTLTGKKAQRA